MNQKKTTLPVSLLSVGVLAILCLVVSAQQPNPTPPPSPSPAPTPAPQKSCSLVTTKPNPSQKSYTWQTCIVAKFAAYLSVGTNKYIELENGSVNSASKCNKTATDTSMLIIDFPCSQLELEFAQNNTQIFVRSINGNYTIENKTENLHNSTILFPTLDAGHYYKCNAEQAVFLTPTNVTTPVQLVLSNVAYEAFRSTTGTDFYKVPQECALDSSQVSDLVRIGVGICLVALVALVLVAYFVGRRRWAERSSYESV